ncbi:LLM class F420-dependent oxidoreductase [Mycolicibacterium fortuitum]|uniref:TIGR03560 family F420-dependent LLM class oxidoreductase n=1 Tax=Mycolicibacterium fortuitum TaxID=1766 RepID=UPI0007EC03F4|nr:TIGR03560 family F420-dependent LLM class oxidoreductase [Mycolicibacterium fortuitum]OBG47682.1 LLM class F420-dependent oxidoreductase [Mycolicibacterium fortuitum]
MPIRLGLHVTKFPSVDGVTGIFRRVVEQVREAEAAGFHAAFVMDHFYQLPQLGAPDEPMLEAYTALGALAAATEQIQLGALVTGNTYRNPALLAKAVTTLDVISQGRAILGLGAGWYQHEHEHLGFKFGTFTERFAKLGETIQIIVPMIRGDRPTYFGKYYHVTDAIAEPRFRSRIPLLIGGSGEKKTIPLAARHFDHLNIIANFDELPGKVAVARQACEDVGRDPKTLETSVLVTVKVIGGAVVSDHIARPSPHRVLTGPAESIADQVHSKVLAAGIDGVILNVLDYTPGVLVQLATALGLADKDDVPCPR